MNDLGERASGTRCDPGRQLRVTLERQPGQRHPVWRLTVEQRPGATVHSQPAANMLVLGDEYLIIEIDEAVIPDWVIRHPRHSHQHCTYSPACTIRVQRGDGHSCAVRTVITVSEGLKTRGQRSDGRGTCIRALSSRLTEDHGRRTRKRERS